MHCNVMQCNAMQCGVASCRVVWCRVQPTALECIVREAMTQIQRTFVERCLDFLDAGSSLSRKEFVSPKIVYCGCVSIVCGWSDEKKRVRRHYGCESLGEVIDEVVRLGPQQASEVQSYGCCEDRVESNPNDEVQTLHDDVRNGV